MNRELAHAIRVLRQHGVLVDRKKLDAQTPKIDRASLARFKSWAHDAWSTGLRFVVGWKHQPKPHLVFHSMSGLAGRQAHAKVIQEKANAK